jgi:hypothetical protein
LRLEEDRPRFDALLREAPRALDFRDDDFLAEDFRAPALRLDLRLDERFAADLRDDFRDAPARFRAPAFLREPPLLERPPVREPLRDDFFLDAMNSLLMRWWCDDAKQDSRAL